LSPLVLAGAPARSGDLVRARVGFPRSLHRRLFLGDARLPFKGEIERFSGSLASLAELVVFVALGLTIDIGGLTGRVWFEGIVLALALALIARPLVVLLTVGTARLSWAERAFITRAVSRGQY
jgi:potassium/hydrogen antiporter